MINVPRELYSKEIISFIKYLVIDENAKYFYDLDDIHKNKLISLGIKALDNDIDIIIGSNANKHLAARLLSYDRDDEIELFNAIQESAYEKFSSYYDIMIYEIKDDLHSENLWNAGFIPYQDSQTGETLWRKSA